MKKLIPIFIVSLLSVSVLVGCTDQVNAPEINVDIEQSETNELTTEKNNEDTSGETAEINNETNLENNQEITMEISEPFDQLKKPEGGDKVAIIETDLGTIKFKLFTELAPEITKNFEELSKEKKYNDVPFHRVVKDFMIQTGDFTDKNGFGGHSYKGPNTTIKDEISPNLKHLFGAVSMANRGPNTNGSQFFIVTNTDGTDFLDGGYSVFGQVYEGMDVALEIQDLQVAGTEAPSKVVNMINVEVQTL